MIELCRHDPVADTLRNVFHANIVEIPEARIQPLIVVAASQDRTSFRGAILPLLKKPTSFAPPQIMQSQMPAVSGTKTATLPAFSIVVTEGNSKGNVTLSWQAPTSNADGTTLVDLKGYKVHYGPSSKTYSDTIQVTNPGITTYVVDNLKAGQYYFAVTAYNAAGQESSLSSEVSTQVD